MGNSQPPMARAFTRMVRLCRLAACRGASVPVAMMVFGVPLIKPVSKKNKGWIPSLKLTANAPKNGGLAMGISFLQGSIFRGYVSFLGRVGLLGVVWNITLLFDSVKKQWLLNYY